MYVYVYTQLYNHKSWYLIMAMGHHEFSTPLPRDAFFVPCRVRSGLPHQCTCWAKGSTWTGWRHPGFPPWLSGRCLLPSGKHEKSYGKSPFLMGKSTISMAISNSYVELPEGTKNPHSPTEHQDFEIGTWCYLPSQVSRSAVGEDQGPLQRARVPKTLQDLRQGPANQS